ncbi:MAG: Holliday junction branch migration protein RuvA [Firmicutes bacterium]|nr:Holliday junction branch migration protein RuvA [Bacillota bacterium]
MLAFVQGQPVDSGSDHVVIAVGGLGYKVFVPASGIERILTQSTVTLHTHMVVKEDRIFLFGTETAAELAVFRHLISVSGVGPKMALAVLSTWPVKRLGAIFAEEDLHALTTIPGVGRKTAQRMLLELKDKIQVEPGQDVPKSSGMAADAEAALLALGYKTAQVRPLVQELARTETAVEDIIRIALSRLVKGGN